MSDDLPVKTVEPLPAGPDEIIFDEPWQAQVIAMADLLIQSKQLSATDWSAALGEQLTDIQNVSDEISESRQNYYQAALAALMQLVDLNEIIPQQQLDQREQDWKDAYLSTPHGQPVELKK